MPAVMPHDPQRLKMIKTHLKQQEEDVGGKDRLPKEKLIVKGVVQQAPIYRIPLDVLAFNKVNGRINAEILEKEAEIGRYLDASSSDDQKVIKEILLSIEKNKNIEIKEDLKKNGQIRPGIITCDGIVVNGNRRKALFEELFSETNDEKFKYLEVQVLPSDITKSEIWLIEAGIQMSAPQQLDYSPINNLLKLREGVTSGLSVGEIANRLYGVQEEEIEKGLALLGLIDDYLKVFLNKSKRYYLVNKLIEHFINLQTILTWANRPRGPIGIDWEFNESDINELKVVAFYYIRAKFPHMRIRELNKLFATKITWEEIKNALKIPLEVDTENVGSADGEPTPDVNDEDDFNKIDGANGFTTTVEEEDKRKEIFWNEQNKEKLKSFYENAKEQQQIFFESDQPLKLANRALNNILAISTKTEVLNDPDIDPVLQKIITETNIRRKIIKKIKPI